MKRSSITTRVCRTTIAAGIGALAGAALAATPLADQPVFSSVAVPGNLALANTYWSTEVAGSNSFWQRTKRLIFRVPHYASGEELARRVAAARAAKP